METRITETAGEQSKKPGNPVPNLDILNLIKNEVPFEVIERNIKSIKS